jgi:hypothetical protein
VREGTSGERELPGVDAIRRDERDAAAALKVERLVCPVRGEGGQEGSHRVNVRPARIVKILKVDGGIRPGEVRDLHFPSIVKKARLITLFSNNLQGGPR